MSTESLNTFDLARRETFETGVSGQNIRFKEKVPRHPHQDSADLC